MTPALGTILQGGLLAGALDIAAAIAVWALRGVAPACVLQSVAGGLLGRGAWAGGAGTALLGGVLHFVIAARAALEA